MFIGRQAELQFLEDCYASSKAQLVIVYGRRRVGKTETLRTFCQGKPHVFYSCTQTTDKLQLAKFSAALLRENPTAARYISAYADWETAFSGIPELAFGDTRRLVVIDEFPYMCRGNDSIPSILQNLWDNVLRQENVMIVLCGSAMSFIEKELLAEKNPLYGRATGIYKMQAMGFYDAIRFFPSYSPYEKILAYSILGGIPHYLAQWEPTLSPSENIRQNILRKGCVLYSEVEFLLHQELRETAVYNTIIEAVALGGTRLNDISQRAFIDNTAKTNAYLRSLIELGIIERQFSVDTAPKATVSPTRGYYRLTDNFFRFWYTFGYPNLSLLEDGDADGVCTHTIEPALHAFASYTFEDVCREFVRKLQKENALPFRYARLGRWFGKTTVRDPVSSTGTRIAETEIDLVAIDAAAQNFLIGECKFKSAPFRYSEFLDTAAKLSPLKKSAAFTYALFSESGFDPNIPDTFDGANVLRYALEEITTA